MLRNSRAASEVAIRCDASVCYFAYKHNRRTCLCHVGDSRVHVDGIM